MVTVKRKLDGSQSAKETMAFRRFVRLFLVLPGAMVILPIVIMLYGASVSGEWSFGEMINFALFVWIVRIIAYVAVAVTTIVGIRYILQKRTDIRRHAIILAIVPLFIILYHTTPLLISQVIKILPDAVRYTENSHLCQELLQIPWKITIDDEWQIRYEREIQENRQTIDELDKKYKDLSARAMSFDACDDGLLTKQELASLGRLTDEFEILNTERATLFDTIERNGLIARVREVYEMERIGDAKTAGAYADRYITDDMTVWHGGAQCSIGGNNCYMKWVNQRTGEEITTEELLLRL